MISEKFGTGCRIFLFEVASPYLLMIIDEIVSVFAGAENNVFE